MTAAPLWMLSVPLVPTMLEPDTDDGANVPVLPLVKVRLPVFPLSAMLAKPPRRLEPAPSTVTVPFADERANVQRCPALETLPPAATFSVRRLEC